MTEQEWREWQRQCEAERVQTRVMRVGGRRWVVRVTWRGWGTSRVRIVRMEKRRIGWESGRWQQIRCITWVGCGQPMRIESEVWS
jgi:hypothetical protein